MSRFIPPPGTADITPSEVGRWRDLEKTACSVFSLYGYGEIRTPVFEYTEVFERGLGDQTEVVQKEMYTFLDRGGRSLTLRPEGTAGVIRSLAGTDVFNGIEQRVFYIGPMFRGERPAAGRRRQFHQIGVENAGREHPFIDAECIMMLVRFLKEAGIPDAQVRLNTRGVKADREAGAAALKTYFAPHIHAMCPDCRTRFEKNIWRILDCKAPECQAVIEQSPNVTEFFTEESKAYFKEVCSILDRNNIAYTIDPRLVRGLDYYVHTVFELTHSGLGAQTAIAGGGRYLLTVPGAAKPMPGVGFAAGMERLLMVQDALGTARTQAAVHPVFVATLGTQNGDYARHVAGCLREAGIPAMIEPETDKSLKSQMRTANRLNADYVALVGDDEAAACSVTLKTMADGTQQTLPLSALPETLKRLIDPIDS